MKYILSSLLLLLSGVSIQASTDNGRLMVHLLDYVATDYSNAVSQGVIVDSFEYQEMLDFSSSINALTAESGDQLDAGSIKLCTALDSLIKTAAPAEQVYSTATSLKKQIIKGFGIEVSPSTWPNIENGHTLYQANCLSCHGAKGDGNGPSAPGLEPSPTNFTDVELMSQKSPLQAYHTISFGVEGTSMVPFKRLSENEKWDLAFYIHTLRKGPDEIQPKDQNIDLREVASKNDQELLENYVPGIVRWHRMHKGAEESVEESHLDKATRLLKESLAQVKSGNYKEARSLCLMSYLEGIEPVEHRIKAQNPSLVMRIEEGMGLMRNAIENEAAPKEIQRIQTELINAIAEARQYLEEAKPSFWLTFSLAASVILREGLEAFLIVIIILSVLRKAGAQSGIKWVHAGWMTAVGLGVASWFFADWLIQLGGMQRELLEGIVALVAVAILFYIGFWMHGKAEAKKWSEFVKKRINNILDTQSMWGLAALSFLVVFREAFESVLFLSAINLDKASNTSSALGLGVLSAFAIVGIIAYLMLRFSKKIPITQLFKISAFLIAVLSIVLVGKGIHAIQETGYIGISPFPVHINIGVLGIYPTVQTMVAQLCVLLATFGIWRYQNRTLTATSN